MAKKSSTSSRRAGLVRRTSEDIKSRKWTKKEREILRRHAAKQAAGDDSDINYSDIPPLTDEQLAAMVPFRQPHPLPKIAVSVRLDPQVVAWLKSKGAGHLTRINEILTRVMEADQRTALTR